MKKQKIINIVLIDTDAKTIRVAKIGNSLKTFYEKLKCSTIDIVSRNFDGRWLDVICDDEGLLKSENHDKPAIITTRKNKNGEDQVVEQIVGNCIIASHDEDGETTSLEFEDIEAIKNCLFRFFNGQTGLIASV